MKHIRHYVAFMFIIATLIASLHEVIHDHKQSINHTEVCYIYQYAQTPILLDTPTIVLTATYNFEPIPHLEKFPSFSAYIQNKSRSPPTA